jgi:multidrug efflux pump subunit AcrB
VSQELDLENDQSIIDNTQLVPKGKGYFTMEIELPNGHKITHTELTAEEARKVMTTWCQHVRDQWRSVEAAEAERQTRNILEKRRAREDAERRAASETDSPREAELRAKLPQSERARDEERQGSLLTKPKPRVEQPQPVAPAPREQLQPINQDPLAYAKAQYVYWTEEESKLEHASKMRAKWERVLQVLREDD